MVSFPYQVKWGFLMFMGSKHLLVKPILSKVANCEVFDVHNKI